MTSQSHPAAVHGPRRPSPPRPAGAGQPVAAPPAGAAAVLSAPVTYVPEAYDPRQGPASPMVSGQVGIVYPSRRSGRAVWVVLSLIVAAIAGFIGWRVMHTGSAAEPGIAYTSTEGHYMVRFPAQPSVLTKKESNGHTKLVVHLAAVPGQAVVADAEIVGPITAQTKKLAEKFSADMGAPGELTLTGVRQFSFEGHRAQQGNFIDATSGQLMSLLEVAASDRRIYVVMGLTGPTFDALEKSFQILP